MPRKSEAVLKRLSCRLPARVPGSRRVPGACRPSFAVAVFAGTALLAVGAFLAFRLFPIESARPPNILLIVVDALRADHLGTYGYGRPTSPFLDRLAARGIVFTRAYSTTAWTLPAVASLFTAQRPHELRPGARLFVFPGSATLAATLGRGGYLTAAFVANPILKKERGFGVGFDSFYTAPLFTVRHPTWADLKFPARRLNRHIFRWLVRKKTKAPWFLYVHYMEPHHPYVPGEVLGRRFWRDNDAGFLSQREKLAAKMHAYGRHVSTRVTKAQRSQLIDLYDAEVAEVDAAIGELVSELNARSKANMVVCVTADHGEAFAEHGSYLHAHSLFEELIRVPLILVLPGQPAAKRSDRVVQITDVAPTVLRLAGMRLPATFTDSSVLDPMPEAGRPALAELAPGPRDVHRQALISGNEKLLVGIRGAISVFDLRADPGEKQNLAARDPAAAKTLRAALGVLTRYDRPKRERQLETGVLDDATREAMRALGYIP